MQVVRHLVGVHANQGRLDAIDGEQEVVEGDADQRLVEDPPRQWVNMGPERTAPPHGVFPEPRLRLVDAERDRLPHRCTVVLGVEPLVVEAVPGLVEHAEQRVAEVVGLEADGDPAVTRPIPVQNGCGVVSSRPRWKSKPIVAATVSQKIRWRSIG